MARLSRFVAVAVLLGGATVSLSGCTGDSDPVVTPSPSVTVVTPSPSASPSPTALSDEELLALIPEEARGQDFVSASNFAKFFVGAYTGLFVDGADVGLYRALSAEGCSYCASALANAVETAQAGAHSEGGVFSFPDLLGRGGLRDDGFTYVAQPFALTDATTFGPEGEPLGSGRGGTGDVGVKMRFDDGAWRVYAVEFSFDDE